MRDRDDHFGATLTQKSDAAARGGKRLFVVRIKRAARLLGRLADAEQTQPHAVNLDDDAVFLDVLAIQHPLHAGAIGKIEIGRKPRELRFLDASIERRIGIAAGRHVELVIAEGHEHTIVEGFGITVEAVHRLDHGGAPGLPADQRRRQEVAGVEQDRVRRVAFDPLSQRPHASKTAVPALGDTLHAVDVVDRQKGEMPFRLLRDGGGHRQQRDNAHRRERGQSGGSGIGAQHDIDPYFGGTITME